MTTPQSIAIGIDVGGSFIKAGLVNSAGRILSFHKHPTPQDDKQLISRIAQSVCELEKKLSQQPEPHAELNSDLSGACADIEKPMSHDSFNAAIKIPEPHALACADIKKPKPHESPYEIAIALPGPLDPQRNTILRSINLPFLQGKLIAEDLFRVIQRRPILVTDAEATTWGEYAARSPTPERFVHLRIGTGVACGLIIDGKMQPLKRNENQHPSDLIVDHADSAIECPCGLRGCLETVASGKALEKFAHEHNYENGLTELQQRWEEGDSDVRNMLTNIAQSILVACNQLIERYRPNIITIGGGVIDTLPGLFSMILSCASKTNTQTLPNERMQSVEGAMPKPKAPACLEKTENNQSIFSPTRIEPARLSDYAGVVGAALMALRPHQPPSNNS